MSITVTQDAFLQGVMDDLVRCGGSPSATAKHRGITRAKVRYYIEVAEARGITGSTHAVEPDGIETDEVSDGPVPMSENPAEFHEDWTADDCIERLRQVAGAHPEKVITRNFFRVTSGISESTWNRYFGTFEEYKRQAEITLSRHAHGLERAIAKHASVSRKKDLNEQKQGWEGRFLRPSGNRFQTALICSDIHDIHCDPFYRRLLIDTARRAQPEKIVIDGDLYDLPEFSKYGQDPREFNPLERIRWVQAFLRELRDAAPNAEIILIEGNHEYRLLRHLSEQTPALKVILSDLHGFTVSRLLGLDEFGINLIARADLASFNERDIRTELRKNYVVLWDALLFGHYPEMRSMGYPGANGHHHKHIVTPGYSPTFGPFEWHQMGSGYVREASYCAGEKWGNGFLLAHCDTHKKRSQFEYADVSHEHAVIGGLFYERTEAEPVPDLIGVARAA
jgi:hypothetical protein